MNRQIALLAAVACAAASAAFGQPVPVDVPPPTRAGDVIRLATYNVENWRTHFEAHRLRDDPAVKALKGTAADEVMQNLRHANDEDNWEVARVITDPDFSPDVIVFQEGPAQRDLEYFNTRWLGGMYATVLVFDTNTTRDQHLGAMLKPGFKVVERRDEYHREQDKVPNDRGGKLFARGPGFLLVESPTGYRFWIGTTHQKSKGGGNDAPMTAWRNREAARTHEIMKELAAAGPDDVVLLGDTNDELGVQDVEADPGSGGDATMSLLGPPADRFVLATRELSENGAISYGGYANAEYRSFIDHVVLTPAVADQVVGVEVFAPPVASVASDHYPVYIDLKPGS